MKHGLTKGGKWHPLYRILKNIEARCRYPKATHYEYYGGRGISVCREWTENPLAFVQWAEENGWAAGLEIDRKDSDDNYCPENCRIINHQKNSQLTRRITTTETQARQVKDALALGTSIKDSALAAGVSYMVAWHIKNSPGVWSNV